MGLRLTDPSGASCDPIGDAPERAELRATLRDLIARESPPGRVAEFDEAGAFDDRLHARLAEIGVFGIGAPAPEGAGGDVRDQIVVIEELAAGPTSMAVFAVVQYMGVQLLSELGTAEQRARVLAPLAAGEAKVAFALSEPGGGTDVARAMATKASQRPDGSWELNGVKLWISGAGRATFLITLARTAPAEASTTDGITMLLVPGDAPGLSVRELDTIGVHSLDTCEVRLDGVLVGPDAVLGEVGQGFRHVLGTLNRERLNVAAGAIGAGRAALEAAVAYAGQREAFGNPIGAFQTLQHRLVDGAIAIEAARGLMVRAAEIEAGGGRADLLASMAKVAASEAAVRITQDGLHLMGGFGYSREFPMQRWFRDVRLWTFSPLTNEMVRNYLGEKLLGLPRSF